MQVREIMTPSAELIDANAMIRDAARTMRVQDLGALPVGDGGRLIGIITDRDIVMVDAPYEGGARQQVAKRPAPRGSALNPWLDPALTSCEKVDESLGRHRGHKGE
jgi:CBS-domain-containing membrane protein